MVLRLWRGEIDLWKIFWLFGAGRRGCPGIVYFSAMLALTDVPDDATAAKFLAALALLLIYLTWAFTGIWRAATRYDGDRTLALAAKATVVGGAGCFLLLAWGVVVG